MKKRPQNNNPNVPVFHRDVEDNQTIVLPYTRIDQNQQILFNELQESARIKTLAV